MKESFEFITSTSSSFYHLLSLGVYDKSFCFLTDSLAVVGFIVLCGLYVDSVVPAVDCH